MKIHLLSYYLDIFKKNQELRPQFDEKPTWSVKRYPFKLVPSGYQLYPGLESVALPEDMTQLKSKIWVNLAD